MQKVFSARDLPATFDIDVPTPKDKYPVYPRMVFVRREVLSPGQKPLPLPGKRAHEPRSDGRRRREELEDVLPNPLHRGHSVHAGARVVRARKTMTLELTPGPIVTGSGQPAAGDLLRWPKNNQEKVDSVAYLVGGELKGLPALKDLAEARLVFPVIRAHNKRAGRKSARQPLQVAVRRMASHSISAS